MLVKKTVISAICDNCKAKLNFESLVLQEVEDKLAEKEWLTKDDKHYCDPCYSYDDEKILFINKNKYKP